MKKMKKAEGEMKDRELFPALPAFSFFALHSSFRR
jgi:hypothetical protein